MKLKRTITGDNSLLAHPVHQDKDVKETTTYKSTNILRNKRQLAISRGRYVQLMEKDRTTTLLN
ncbi:MAG: hypothetical protein R2750_10170 [Bacteroidales bacterium]